MASSFVKLARQGLSYYGDFVYFKWIIRGFLFENIQEMVPGIGCNFRELARDYGLSMYVEHIVSSFLFIFLVGLKSLGTSMLNGKCTCMCWRPESSGMIAIESLMSWSSCSSSKLLWLLSHLQVLQRLLLIRHSLHKLAVIKRSEFESSSSAEILLVRSK